MRKTFSPQFKAKVALSAIRNEMAMAQLSSKYEVHRVQIVNWRKQVIDRISSLFQDKQSKHDKDQEKLTDELYRQIGRLKVENEWLKKKVRDLNLSQKKELIDQIPNTLSIRRQCELLQLNRSNLYYEQVLVSKETLNIMNRIDEIYTAYPFYGSRKITVALKQKGWSIL